VGGGEIRGERGRGGQRTGGGRGGKGEELEEIVGVERGELWRTCEVYGGGVGISENNVGERMRGGAVEESWILVKGRANSTSRWREGKWGEVWGSRG